jgi:serine/threonine-protein kinase
MEYIEGLDIESYIKAHVYSINKIFIQTIEGFSYLEKNKILHRDIRSTNIMINNDGIVTIIDFGFGKDIRKSDNFSLSITLNWQCDIPLDFENGEYTFSTEIYFLGQLFKRIIASCQISSIFKYNGIIKKMCELAPSQRFQSFNEIKKIMYENLQEEEFSTNDKKIYSAFADSLMNVCPSISYDAKCKDNLEEITMNLEALLKNSSLEEYLQNNSLLIKCFISGAYKYEFKKIVPVKQIKEFTQWWKNFSDSKKNIILNNLWERFEPIMEDYLPF